MAMTDTYNDLLRDFANHVGVDPEVFGKTQEIVVDGIAVGLDFEGTDDFADVLYFCNVGAPSDARQAEVYKVLLQANNLWAGTGGATIGVQQDTGNVVIAGRMDLEGLSPEGLAALVDAFVDTASFWKKFIADELPRGDDDNINFQFAVRG